jgi:hypothetical protein
MNEHSFADATKELHAEATKALGGLLMYCNERNLVGALRTTDALDSCVRRIRNCVSLEKLISKNTQQEESK